MDHPLTTGEFARLCGTTKHTLYHYDQMGVLSPELVGDNGYRYYSPLQLDLFRVVETLRELDMPLAEIRAYLDRRSPAEFAALMEEKERELDEKIARLRRMRQLVRRRAELTRRAMDPVSTQPTLVREPVCYLVRTPALPMTSDWNVATPLAEHVRFCQRHGISSPYSVGCMATQEGVRAGDPAGYTHYYTRLDRRPRGVEVFVRPAGEYLTLLHTTGFVELPGSYRRMLDYARDQGLTLAGPFYEDELLDEMSVRDYSRYLLRLSILTVP